MNKMLNKEKSKISYICQCCTNGEAQGLTEEDISNYKIDSGNYFVNISKKDEVSQIKKYRTVIVIIDDPKWKK